MSWKLITEFDWESQARSVQPGCKDVRIDTAVPLPSKK